MTPLRALTVDIDYMPELCHPLVGAFIDPSLDLTESQTQAIKDAILYAYKLMYSEN